MARIVEADKNKEERAAIMAEETGHDELEGTAWLADTEKVEFLNNENPGLAMKFVFGSTKNPQRYTLFHGGTYDLPKKVIDHLESLGAPINKYIPDGMGNMVRQAQGYTQRFTLRRVRGR